MTTLRAGLSAHPDRAAVTLIIAVAAAIRLAFATSAPPFLNADSSSYYLPARDLAAGRPLDLDFHRTPTYPLVIAAVIGLVGEDLQRLVTLQHVVFGPSTALLTYALGRLLTSRAVALTTALLAAVSGPKLLYEHYVMSEAPFGLLLLATLVAVVLAGQRAGWRWAAPAGLLFGILVLCRPVAQVLVPLLVGALVSGPLAVRGRVVTLVLFGLGASMVLLPWMAYNHSQHGVFGIASSGRFLIARLVKEDPGGFSFETSPGVVEEPTRAAARRIVQEEAERVPPTTGLDRLRRELGLSDADAHRMLFDLAVAAIRDRPIYYLEGSTRFFLEVFLGTPIAVEREGLEWEQVDWGRRGRAVLERTTYPLDAPRAQALLSLYDPARYGLLVPVMFVAGLVLAALGFAPRRLLLPGLAAVLLTAVSAALGGHEVRHRYPQDPLIALLAVQAMATAIATVKLWRRSPVQMPGAERTA